MVSSSNKASSSRNNDSFSSESGAGGGGGGGGDGPLEALGYVTQTFLVKFTDKKTWLPTDRATNGHTSYRDAWTHLKTNKDLNRHQNECFKVFRLFCLLGNRLKTLK